MIDEELAKEIGEMREKGTLGKDPEKIMKLMEFFKQATASMEEIEEELEDLEKFEGQMVIPDKDFKFWVRIGEGEFDYGKGVCQNPSFTMSANWETMDGMMSGEVDGTSAYMSGDLQIEGNLQDTIAYGDFLQYIAEVMEEHE